MIRVVRTGGGYHLFWPGTFGVLIADSLTGVRFGVKFGGTWIAWKPGSGRMIFR